MSRIWLECGSGRVPRDIVIPVSRLSPLEAEASFFAVLVEPFDPRARQRLIAAEYRLFQPMLLHLETEGTTKHDAKLHKRAVRVIQQERLLAAECARAHIAQAIAREHGAEGVMLQEDGEERGPLTMENVGLWAVRVQRQLGGRRDDPNKVTAKNFQQGAWRASKPVLHLALVVHKWTRNCAPVMKPLGAGALSEAFDDPGATRELFDIAEQYRDLLLRIARGGAFTLEERETVRLIAA
jgi:hypothetical protein